MDAQKTVWVTGASSGLGLHTAAALRDDGWQVIAGARSFSGGQRDGMTCLPLDVTDENSIRDFCGRAAEIALPDALVQCAGMLVLGSCEETETEECFTHMSIEQAIVNEDDMSDDWDYDWDYIGQTKSDIESWRGEKNEKL